MSIMATNQRGRRFRPAINRSVALMRRHFWFLFLSLFRCLFRGAIDWLQEIFFAAIHCLLSGGLGWSGSNRLVVVVVVSGSRNWRLVVDDIGLSALDDHLLLLVPLVGQLVDHQQFGLVGDRLDALDHLPVVLVADVDQVDLDDAVALTQSGHLCGRVGVHFADVLTALGLFGVQVESIAVEVRPLDQVTQAGTGTRLVGAGRLRLHLRGQSAQWVC